MLAERVFSCPRAGIGAEWEAIDKGKGVSAIDLNESPRKARVAGVNGLTGLHAE